MCKLLEVVRELTNLLAQMCELLSELIALVGLINLLR